MAALQGIKRRIRSVRSTRQITKAQQLVEAGKLRRTQTAAEGPHDYAAAAEVLLGRLAQRPSARQHGWFVARPVKRALTIVIAGDRGMAGGYNANVLRALGRHLHEMTGVEHRAIAIGKRAASHIARASDIDEVASYVIDKGDADTTIARPALEEVVQQFGSGEVDAVHIIYTHFVSTVSYEVMTKQLLPIVGQRSEIEPETEPEPEDMLEYAARRALEGMVVQAVLESRASENASRMLAMKNATDNAEDLISDLTLAFNNARQASITQEIAEISAGAEAITE